GMDELRAQARRTAEEARAIDEAFQDRVKRNFEMLSEAVRLMGVAAVAPSAGEPAAARPIAPPDPGAPDPADAPALRSRIRLTPTATDREFSEVFRAAGGQPPPEAEDPP